MAIIANESLLENLGDRLKAERKRLGWTREKMAENGQVSRATQRLYDLTERVPPLIYLYRLGNAGADLGYLLFGESARVNSDNSLVISQEALRQTFKLVAEMLISEQGRISTPDQAAELLLTLLKEIHTAESPEIDFNALNVTETESNKAIQ